MLSQTEWAIVALSMQVAAIAVLGTLPLAMGLAFVLARYRFPGKTLLDALVHLPLVLPPVVTGWLLLLAFGAQGPIGRWLEHSFGLRLVFHWTGAALAAGLMALPLMVRAMRLAFEGIDPRLAMAARTFGASPLRAFATITLPLALPGVLAGLVLGLARSLGEFGATITFASNIPGQTQTLPLAIYSALQLPGGEVQVTRLALCSLVLSLAALIASEALTRHAQPKRSHHER